MVMPQWFVNCDSMASLASQQVSTKEMSIEPRTQEKTWYRWLDNIHEWCISRQLWWGHRIPAYRVKSSHGITDLKEGEDQWIVARSLKEAERIAVQKHGFNLDEIRLEQDPDVLDTWFSSALLPISAFGWPTEDSSITEDHTLNKFYPLSVMETGNDILFFWVARMAMLCEEMVGEKAFERILLHPLVRDKSGRKMSKSLGNVIDPLHVIEGVELQKLVESLQMGNLDGDEVCRAEKSLKEEFPDGIPRCGADALRFTLASYLQQDRQINMDVQKVISHRHFCNKIWNAFKFALPYLEDSAQDGRSPQLKVGSKVKRGLAERWILSRLAGAVQKCNDGLNNFNLSHSTISVYNFFINDLCDVYIEFSKPSLNGKSFVQLSEEELEARREGAAQTLFSCLDLSMRMLHPFMPYITEELWQRMHVQTREQTETAFNSILEAEFPNSDAVQYWKDPEAEESMKLVLDVLHAIRSLKHTRSVLVSKSGLPTNMELVILCEDERLMALVETYLADIQGQTRIDTISIVTNTEETLNLKSSLVYVLSDTCKVYLPVEITPEVHERLLQEIKKLRNREKKFMTNLKKLNTRLALESYREKAPEEILRRDHEKKVELEEALQSLAENISSLELLQLERCTEN